MYMRIIFCDLDGHHFNIHRVGYMCSAGNIGLLPWNVVTFYIRHIGYVIVRR